MLAAVLNPCPCGYYTDPRKECRCTPPRIMKYINKISGPLLDRVDIHIEVPPVNPSFKGHKNGETSNKIRERGNRARDVQTERFKNDDIHCNARENRHIKKCCNPLPEAEKLLALAMRELNSEPACRPDFEGWKDDSGPRGGERHPVRVHLPVQYRVPDRLEWWGGLLLFPSGF